MFLLFLLILSQEKGAITPKLKRSDPNFVTAHQRRQMKENPSPHHSLTLRSRFIDSQMIERSIKRGFKLNQTVRSPKEIVIPVELDFV